MAENTSPPDATMLLGTHCPHCPSVLKHLAELIKTGELGRLHIINLEQHPDEAQQYGVRSVPWVKIGKYELSGAQELSALRQRIQWANQQASLTGEFDHLLSEAQAEKVLDRIKSQPETMAAIIELLGDPATVLSTRIGIGVVMEEFAGTELIQQQIPVFAKLATHKDARIRADVLHYLGLTHSKEAIPILQQHIEDKDPEVREAAVDSLEALENEHAG